MSNQKPKVSVLMPVFKTPEMYLREAIESILDQTYTNFEFLILDDCPEESVESIVKSYKDSRIRYLKNESNIGISDSRNKLIDLSQGEYLAVMDHDDVAMPKRFEKEVAFLDEHREVGVVGTWYKTFPDVKIKTKFITNSQIEHQLMYGCAVLHPSSMIRKDVLMKHNIRYESAFTPAEDYVLWCRLIGKTKFANIPEVLQLYRDYPNNTSKTKARQMEVSTKRIQLELKQQFPVLMKEATGFEKQSFKIFGIPLIKKKTYGGMSRYKILGCIKIKKQEPVLLTDPSELPIYIISFNRLSYLKQMVEMLEKYHLYNIHIIDNASTYPPLLEYLKTTPYTVHRMNKNYGHMVFFEAPEFKKVRENDYYVVTDPDVAVIQDCPSDFMNYFYQILLKYPKYNKVGFSLKIDDIGDETEYQKVLKLWERQFYRHKINIFKPYLYDSAIDTTFALYRPQKQWRTTNFYKAIRVAFPYETRHLPWYQNLNQLSDEDKFYVAQDIGSGNWNDASKVAQIYDLLISKKPEHFADYIFSIKSSSRRTVVRLFGIKITIKKTKI